MLDLKQLTADVCRIATEVGLFLKEERKNFRRERVVEKHAHDYVSYEESCARGRLRPRTLVSYSIPELWAKIMSFL